MISFPPLVVPIIGTVFISGIFTALTSVSSPDICSAAFVFFQRLQCCWLRCRSPLVPFLAPGRAQTPFPVFVACFFLKLLSSYYLFATVRLRCRCFPSFAFVTLCSSKRFFLFFGCNGDILFCMHLGFG